MKKPTFAALAVAAVMTVAPATAAAVAAILRPAPPPNGNGVVAYTYFGPAGNVAPQGGATGPDAQVMYESRWQEGQQGVPPVAAFGAPGIGARQANLASGPIRRTVLNYCVFPSIAIQESVTPPRAPASADWQTPFVLTLVELAAVPTTPVFAPIEVLVPIPVNTTRRLGPPWLANPGPADPKPWCGQTLPGQPLPRLYLVVNGRPEAQVVWADAPSQP